MEVGEEDKLGGRAGRIGGEVYAEEDVAVDGHAAHAITWASDRD